MTASEQELLRPAALAALGRAGKWLAAAQDAPLVLVGRKLTAVSAGEDPGPLDGLAALRPDGGSSLAPAQALTGDPEQLRAIAGQLGAEARGEEQDWLAVLPAAIVLASRTGDVELLCALTRALLAVAAAVGSAMPPIVGHVVRRLLVSQEASGAFSADREGASSAESVRPTVGCCWLLAAYARPDLVSPIASTVNARG